MLMTTSLVLQYWSKLFFYLMLEFPHIKRLSYRVNNSVARLEEVAQSTQPS